MGARVPRPARGRTATVTLLAAGLLCALTATLAAVPVAAAQGRGPRRRGRFGLHHPFQVRPSVMRFYSPVAHFPTSYIDGAASTRPPWAVGHHGPIRWSRWGRHGAVARGQQWEDDCQPSCPRGIFTRTPLSMRAGRVRDGRYTRLTLRIAAPGLRPLSFHYRLERRGRLHYWGSSAGVADRDAHVQAAYPARLPGLLWHDGGRRGAFLVRPRSVYDTEDGSGVIGVLRRHGDEIEHGSGRGSLRWTRWTATSGRAVGTYWLKLGTPAAASRFTREPLTVRVSRVRGGRFTRMRLRYRQSGRRTDVTLCLSAPYHGSYRWGELVHGRCA